MPIKKKQDAKTKTPAVKREVPECYFTKRNITPNYKDVLILKRFITDRGKLVSQSRSGVSAKNQRILTKEVKKARYMSLIPYTETHEI